MLALVATNVLGSTRKEYTLRENQYIWSVNTKGPQKEKSNIKKEDC